VSNNAGRGHGGSNNGRGIALGELSEATVQRMLAVHEQRIALELKQVEVTLRELDHSQKIADKSIEAQASDRKDERLVSQTMHLHQLKFAGSMVLMILGFTLVALWMNKDALVLDLAKVAFGFIGGWGASIAWRKRSAAKPDE
jgi:hypothetical protein